MLDTAVRGRICRRRPAMRPDRETIAQPLLTVAPAKHSQVIVVAVVLHHQNQDVVDLGKGVRTFRLAGNGALPRAPPPSTTRLRSHGTRLPVLDTDIPRCRAPLNIQAGNNNPEQSLILAVTSDRPGT